MFYYTVPTRPHNHAFYSTSTLPASIPSTLHLHGITTHYSSRIRKSAGRFIRARKEQDTSGSGANKRQLFRARAMFIKHPRAKYLQAFDPDAKMSRLLPRACAWTSNSKRWTWVRPCFYFWYSRHIRRFKLTVHFETTKFWEMPPSHTALGLSSRTKTHSKKYWSIEPGSAKWFG